MIINRHNHFVLNSCKEFSICSMFSIVNALRPIPNIPCYVALLKKQSFADVIQNRCSSK